MKTNTTKTFKTMLAGLSAICATVALALPVVDQSSVTLTQNQRNRLVTVRYVLTGDPAVVTVDFQTNNVAAGTWASIGGDKYAQVIGDVNKLVTNVNSTCTIFWQPTAADAWPNQYIPGENFRAVVKAWATNAPPPYMIVDLKDNPGEKRYYPSAEAIPFGITNDLYKTTCLAFRLVPAAAVQWRMGAPTTEKGQKYDSVNYASYETQHLVTFTNDFYLGVYPVTQRQHKFFWEYHAPAFTNGTPENSYTYPVERVGWCDLRGWHMSANPDNPGNNYEGDWPTDGHRVSAKSAIHKARSITGVPSLDLPTDAMWEYACRAGTSTATYAGDLTVNSSAASASDPVLDKIAWYSANSGNVPHPVGLKQPNGWGFYDMIGNIGEYLLDEFASTMSSDPVVDPQGVETGAPYPIRSIRGSTGFSTIAYLCRSAFRDTKLNGAEPNGRPWLGYRLSCDAMALQ